MRTDIYESTHIPFSFLKNSAVIASDVYTSAIWKSFFNTMIIQNWIKFIFLKQSKSIIKFILNLSRKFLEFLLENSMEDDDHFIF